MNTLPTIIDKPLYVGDIETYFDTFLFAGSFHGCGEVQVFEIGWRRNQRQELLNFLAYLKQIDAFMVGYNNLGFDYPIVHDLINNPMLFNARRAYDLAQEIIDQQKYGFSKLNVSLYNRHIHQVDLMKIWHFDNDAKRTRLKDLQFAMRTDNVMDLPYDFRNPLSSEQIDKLIEYNIHDVTETKKFLGFTAERIKLRRDLITAGTLKGDVMNWNDTKIGEQFFVSKLGVSPQTKGTDRLMVEFKDVILPKIQFRTEDYQDVLETFKTKKWYKGDKDRNSEIPFDRELHGMKMFFGSGGIHGSVNNKVYRESPTHKIIDIDVAGMYPAVGIANSFFPEHLGIKFVDVYKQLKFDRKQHKKGTAMNAVLKLAQNGAYGKSNSQYSPLFDTKYLFSITINGQLQLSMLYEMLAEGIPGAIPLMQNTDGLEMMIPDAYVDKYMEICAEWEKICNLQLEHDEYSKLVLADVNNYIAIYKDGKPPKAKGRFEWEPQDQKKVAALHKNKSFLVIPKAIYNYFVYGISPEQSLKENRNIYDYCGGLKAKGQWYFEERYVDHGTVKINKLNKIVRYYVSKKGVKLVKCNAKDGREMQVNAGRWLATTMNNTDGKHVDMDSQDIDQEYYLQAIYKEIMNIDSSVSRNFKQIEIFLNS